MSNFELKPVGIHLSKNKHCMKNWGFWLSLSARLLLKRLRLSLMELYFFFFLCRSSKNWITWPFLLYNLEIYLFTMHVQSKINFINSTTVTTVNSYKSNLFCTKYLLLYFTLFSFVELLKKIAK